MLGIIAINLKDKFSGCKKKMDKNIVTDRCHSGDRKVHEGPIGIIEFVEQMN